MKRTCWWSRLALATVLGILSLTVGEINAVASPPGQLDVGVLDGRFVDSRYGYEVTWDNELWTSYAPTGWNLGLDSGQSYMLFSAFYGYGGDALACVDDYTQRIIPDDDGVTDVEPVLDRRGQPLAGEQDGWTYAVIQLTFTDPTGVASDRFNVVSCRAIVPEGSVLFNNQIGALEGVTSERALGDAVRATYALLPPEDFIPGVVGTTYEDAQYGYRVSWDERTWRAQAVGGFDMYLESGPSYMIVLAFDDYDGNAAECLTDYLENILLAESGVDEVEPLTAARGSSFPDEDGDWVYGAVRLTFTPTESDSVERFTSARCRTLVPGESVLMMVHIGPLAEFDRLEPLAATVAAEVRVPIFETPRPDDADENEDASPSPKGTGDLFD